MTITNNDTAVKEYRSALDGPSIEEILSAVDVISEFNKRGFPIVSTNNGFEISEVEEHAKAKAVLALNQIHLANQGTTRINKANLMKVIESIKKSGEINFDMTAFLTYTKFIEPHVVKPESFFTDQAFKCNTAGCIAGFATAIATNWKLDERFINNSEMNKSGYLHIACKYLNIPTLVGTSIFLSAEDSIWCFIKNMMEDGVRLSRDFNHIDWATDEYDNYETLIDLSTIDYMAAAELLRMIHDDELLFDEDYLPYLAPSVGGNY